jgi:hypothetical protein
MHHENQIELKIPLLGTPLIKQHLIDPDRVKADRGDKLEFLIAVIFN